MRFAQESVIRATAPPLPQEIFKYADIVTIVDSFLYQGRNGIVITHDEETGTVAVEFEKMDNQTELIFTHARRLRKVV